MGVNPLAVMVNIVSEVLWVFCRDRGLKKTKWFRGTCPSWWGGLVACAGSLHTRDTAPMVSGFAAGSQAAFSGWKPRATGASRQQCTGFAAGWVKTSLSREKQWLAGSVCCPPQDRRLTPVVRNLDSSLLSFPAHAEGRWNVQRLCHSLS